MLIYQSNLFVFLLQTRDLLSLSRNKRENNEKKEKTSTLGLTVLKSCDIVYSEHKSGIIYYKNAVHCSERTMCLPRVKFSAVI